MKLLLPFMAILLFTQSGCNMFKAWRSIPAPGGCEECHTVPISANWQLSYKPATLTDERGGYSFQKAENVLPGGQKPATSLETQKIEQLACFECHKEPSPAHRQRKGRFHH